MTHADSNASGTIEAALYAALGRIAFSDRPMGEALTDITVLTRDLLPETPEVSITLIKDDRPQTVAFSGSLATDLDERQYADGGPCVDAAVSGNIILLTMDDPKNPYTEFAAASRRRGVSHTMSISLEASAGALNIYSQTGKEFTAESQSLAMTIAAALSVFVSNLNLYHSAAALVSNMQTAMASRAVIEQAKGLIMAQERCSPETAFNLLVRLSQHQNVKLRTVAEAIVQHAVKH
jgi:hypothetical protein